MTSQSRERVKRLLLKWEYRRYVTQAEPRPESLWSMLAGYWMRFARMLGKANSILLLTIVYFLIIGPGAILLKLFRKDLLDRRAEKRESYWYEKAPHIQDLEQSKHQF